MMNDTLYNISLLDFPEKISVRNSLGEKVPVYMYGPKSCDNQLALITHYLHNQELAEELPAKLARIYLKEFLECEFPKWG